MTKVTVEIHDNIINVINKLKNINDTGIELEIPQGALIFENVLNLKLLRKHLDEQGKVLHFVTSDEVGQSLINNIDESLAAVATGPTEEEVIVPKPKSKPKLPRFGLPKIKVGVTPIILVGVALLIFGFVGIKIVSGLPQAEVKVVVNSQPLTKSVEIKVKSGNDLQTGNKILAGKTVEATLTQSVAKETTGTKIIGEKAKGKAIVYNKTDEEKEFKDGTLLTYEEDDEEYNYVLLDDITVPARTYEPTDPLDPSLGGTYTNGSAEVEVEAETIGKKYNLDKGEGLEVEDKDNNDFSAKVSEDIDGGKEEEVKVIAQEDLDELGTTIASKIEEDSLDKLGDGVEKGYKLIAGSESIIINNSEFSGEIGDEKEDVELTQTATARGLTYNVEQLDRIMDELVKDFIPEGFILSDKERIINVEILGNTAQTFLNSYEADIQVTLKTFVVPDISEDNLKEELKGKSVSEAQKILGAVRNVKNYEFSLSP
ncbi:hypothetical protein ACFL13_02625, partial [Patescibacteria group bacterium]